MANTYRTDDEIHAIIASGSFPELCTQWGDPPYTCRCGKPAEKIEWYHPCTELGLEPFSECYLCQLGLLGGIADKPICRDCLRRDLNM